MDSEKYSNLIEIVFVGCDKTYQYLNRLIGDRSEYKLIFKEKFEDAVDLLMDNTYPLCVCEDKIDETSFKSFKIELDIYQIDTKFILLVNDPQKIDGVDTLNFKSLNRDYFLDILNLNTRLIQSDLQLKTKMIELGKMTIEQKDRDVLFLNQQLSMLALAKLKLISFDQNFAFQKMTEIVSSTLGVERVSIYFLDSSKHSLICEEEYLYQTFSHQKGRIIERENYPEKLDDAYTWPLICDDVKDNIGLKKFNKIYLEENNVGAMMITPIYYKGQIYGSLQIENLNSNRVWKIDEQNFAQAVTDFIVLAIEAEDLKRDDLRIKESEKAHQYELVKRNKELHEFTSVVSHDLQEPLYKINAFGELLEERLGEELDEKSKFYIGRMRNASKRMSRLIKDLLMYSKTTSEGKEFLQVDLNRLIKDVLIDLELRIDETQAMVKVSKMATIDADITQMQQLFQNIISNSLKFHKEDDVPKVSIKGKKLNPREYQITISDEGIGFDEKDAPKVFQVFKRLSHKKEFEGTGIGLAVCQKIIERHKGSIGVKSEIGKGVKFTIVLPFVQKNVKKTHLN